jgi:Zn-dependent protease with chaperone function
MAAVCVPSYLWLEPKGTQEQVGYLCWSLALLCLVAWGVSITRTMRVLAAGARQARDLTGIGHEVRLSQASEPVMVVETDAPLLAVAGVASPRIVVSRGVLEGLTSQHLDAALAHERAHLASHDNLKRLLMLMAPDAFPFLRGFDALEQAWTRFAEWAADDQAVAGDASRSLSLAAALVRVARMGLAAPPSGVAICFVSGNAALSARVDRLLFGQPVEPRWRPWNVALLGAAATIVCITGGAIAQPSALFFAHRALEHLVR